LPSCAGRWSAGDSLQAVYLAVEIMQPRLKRQSPEPAGSATGTQCCVISAARAHPRGRCSLRR